MSANVLDILKRRIREDRELLAQRFWSDTDVDELVAANATSVDENLRSLWADRFGDATDVALIAVGGYGREELHPYSDIDLLVLVDRRSRAGKDIEGFVQSLWDLNLDIGSSVRTVRECRREAAKDVTVATALYERRLIAGSEALAGKLDKVMARSSLWPSHDFFKAKRDEQNARHREFDNVDYGLEPNIKTSPGGLRDIQTVSWIIGREFGTTDLDELTRRNFLSYEESQILQAGRRFLWRVRYGLHLVANRKEDRLLFDHQRVLAERFGYADRPGRLAVEQFMQAYYRHVLALREVNDILLQHFEDEIVNAKRKPEYEELNERFRLTNNYIDISHEDVFADYPPAMIELFVLCAHRRDIDGVTARTIRAIRRSLPLINEAFRNDNTVTQLFMDLLGAPYTLVTQLTRMRRYGILGRYIPEFGNVIGQMQHDLFHIYTVDAHTMVVLRNMRRFRYRASQDKFPVASHCVKNLRRVELLYIAGLYHDIGKGRGGDHSELGASDVVQFCARHGLDQEDTELVAWLVRVHLLMSTTAQQKDIHDPEIIAEFAQTIGSESRLDYLYALTVADINATNPTLWNDWRATLMRTLYSATRKALRRGLDAPISRAELIKENQALIAEKLAERNIDADSIAALLQKASKDFFLSHTATQAVSILEAVHHHDLTTGPLVTSLDHMSLPKEASPSEIFVYAMDEPHIFSKSVIALDAANLSIHSASVETSADSSCMDSYIVLDADGKSISNDPARLDRVCKSVAAALVADGDTTGGNRLVTRQLRQFNVPARVTLTTPRSDRLSILQVTTADRPGLLAMLGDLFQQMRVTVHNARITTLGERIQDTFVISDDAGKAITSAARIEEIEKTIAAALDETVGATSTG